MNNQSKLIHQLTLAKEEKKNEEKPVVERINDDKLADLYIKTEERIKNNRNKVISYYLNR